MLKAKEEKKILKITIRTNVQNGPDFIRQTVDYKVL